jgi:hypothetical protein
MKNRTTPEIRTALKGRNITAQGNALGQEIAELPAHSPDSNREKHRC